MSINYPGGRSLPSGGAIGAVLTKTATRDQEAGWTTLVTVAHASPVGGGYVTPFVFDDTGTTGGLYAWTGADYVKVGLATS